MKNDKREILKALKSIEKKLASMQSNKKPKYHTNQDVIFDDEEYRKDGTMVKNLFETEDLLQDTLF